MCDCNKLLSKTQKIRDFNAVLLIPKIDDFGAKFQITKFYKSIIFGAKIQTPRIWRFQKFTKFGDFQMKS